MPLRASRPGPSKSSLSRLETMTFAERNRKFIKKLRNLSDIKKQIILWTIVGILGLIMGYFWVTSTIKSFSEIGKSFNSPLTSILQTTTPSNK